MSFATHLPLDQDPHVLVGHGHHVPVGHGHHVPVGHGHHFSVGHGYHVPVGQGHHIGQPSSTLIVTSSGGGTWIGRKTDLLIVGGSLAIITGLTLAILGLLEGMKNPPTGIFCLTISGFLILGGVACIIAAIAKKYIK
jgi:hypothetical protein